MIPRIQGNAIGQKRSGTYELFLVWDLDDYCPCYGHRLRTNSKNARLKRQYNKILKQKEHLQQPKRSEDRLTLKVYGIQ